MRGPVYRLDVNPFDPKALRPAASIVGSKLPGMVAIMLALDYINGGRDAGWSCSDVIPKLTGILKKEGKLLKVLRGSPANSPDEVRTALATAFCNTPLNPREPIMVASSNSSTSYPVAPNSGKRYSTTMPKDPWFVRGHGYAVVGVEGCTPALPLFKPVRKVLLINPRQFSKVRAISFENFFKYFEDLTYQNRE